MEKLLTKTEVIEILGISESTLNRLIKERKIVIVKMDRNVRFRETDIEKFISNRLQTDK